MFEGNGTSDLCCRCLMGMERHLTHLSSCQEVENTEVAQHEENQIGGLHCRVFLLLYWPLPA